MKACAFFGHREYDYQQNQEEIEKRLINLIKEKGVGKFYCGGRGKFDMICAKIISKLKQEYPHIRCTQVLAYIPQDKIRQKESFDDTLYLLERKVVPRYAIIETNKVLVDKVDYIFSGVVYSFGGAFQAVGYARKRGKIIINLFNE